MPTKVRLTIPGALHHVMARGIAGRDLFQSDADREMFLSFLGDSTKKTGYRCYAWVLMSNHYHLLLRASDQPLMELMRGLNAKYARYFNRKHKQRGYVFQDRFKSIVTQDQGYIESLVRYIHLNPIRAGVVRSMKELDHYRWAGHAVLMGKRSCDYQTTTDVLKRFGDTAEMARREYRRFVEKGINGVNENPLVNAVRKANLGTQSGHEHRLWVIGDPEFVRGALRKFDEKRLRLMRYQKEGWTLKRLHQCLAERIGIDQDTLLLRGRSNERSEIRKLFAYIAVRQLGFTATQAGRYLGISTSAVSQSMQNGKTLLKKYMLIKLIN